MERIQRHSQFPPNWNGSQAAFGLWGAILEPLLSILMICLICLYPTTEDYSEYESPYSLHIVPVRENKLLRNELFQSRRRSRSVGDLTQMLKIQNTTGLFARAKATHTPSYGRSTSRETPPPLGRSNCKQKTNFTFLFC